MKIFVSQPMSGRTDEEVLAEREKYVNAFLAHHGFSTSNTYVQIIENYYKPDAPIGAKQPWFLGDSLKQMSEADVVLFVPGWKKATGCRIEMECCNAYNIDYVKMKRI